MHSEIRWIGPAEASLFLQGNTANRSLKKSLVLFFEEQIKRGEWQLTHQGIAISKTGRLLDGQHRLQAIVNTGLPVEMLVTTELSDATFAVLDTGSGRTAADVLSIDGGQNCIGMAAGIRNYILYKSLPNLVWTGPSIRSITSTTSIKKEYDCNADTWQLAVNIARSCFFPNIVVPGPATCLSFLALHENNFTSKYVKDFFTILKEGANLSAGSPVLTYRNKYIQGSAKPNFQERLADYIKLFDAYATGQQLKIFKSQVFPPMPLLIHSSECIDEAAAA